MKDTNTPSENTQHCGLVAIVGAPNAGKSTLVNALVGQKIAIISPKAQTTRARLMGIALQDQTQILLVDTPGIFTPKKRFDRAMVAAAWGSAEGANLVALVVDASSGLTRRIEPLVEAVAARKEPKVIILIKSILPRKLNYWLWHKSFMKRSSRKPCLWFRPQPEMVLPILSILWRI